MPRSAIATPSAGHAEPVPLVDLQAQYRRLRPRIDRAVAEVLESGRFILGPQVTELERALSSVAGVRHAVCVGNGTEALRIALAAEGIGPGDAVFVPALTFVATAEAVVQTGAAPVFVDIDGDTFTMDPAQLARRVDAVAAGGSLRPRAVVPVDLFGLPADYPALRRIAEPRGLFVLADAAQSYGARCAGCRVGALAAATATSFYPSKPLGGYGDGGCLFTDDDERAAAWRSIATHGLHDGVAMRAGTNSRLDTLQAAILLVKLDVLDEELAARARVAAWYDEMLPASVRRPARPDGRDSSWALYSVLVPDREAVMRALAAGGIESRVYYATPLHIAAPYAQYGDGEGSLPVSERVSRAILSLPMHPYLERDTVARVCAAVARALA